MADIEVERYHSLGKEGARSAAEEVARQLQREIGGVYHWEGDRLRFARSGARGHIDVEATRVRVEINVGRLLRPMKRRVRAAVEKYLDQQLDGT